MKNNQFMARKILIIAIFVFGVIGLNLQLPSASAMGAAIPSNSERLDEMPGAIKKAFLAALGSHQAPSATTRWEIFDYAVKDNWASAIATLIDPNDDEFQGELVHVLARKTSQGWVGVTYSSSNWQAWIEQAPKNFISHEMKNYLKTQGQEVTVEAATIFYSPWIAGRSARVNRGHHTTYNVDFGIGSAGTNSADVVAAVADGKVINATWKGSVKCNCKAWSGGNCTGGWVYPSTGKSCPWTEANQVRILHPDGKVSFYLHMTYGSLPEKFRKNYAVEAPVPVRRGETLGVEGTTGWSTGSHLHFGIYKSNNIAGSNSVPFSITNHNTTISSSSMTSGKNWISTNFDLVLSAPANGSTVTEGLVTFSWNTTGASAYYLEYSGPMNGNSGWISGKTHIASLTPGAYTWRVKARNSQGEGTWSAQIPFVVAPVTATFTPTPTETQVVTETPTATFTPTPVAAPELVSPTDGAEITGTGLPFSWNAVSGASQYYLEYWGQVSGNSGWISATSYSPTLAVGAYSWRVKARNLSGEGAWSATQAATLKGVVITINVPTRFIPSIGSCSTTYWYNPGTINGYPWYATQNNNSTPWAPHPNHAYWNATVPVAGQYKIEALIPGHGTLNWCGAGGKAIGTNTNDAHYQVFSNEVWNNREVSQQTATPSSAAWINLNQYALKSGTYEVVHLMDSNHQTSYQQLILFSSIRITWVGP